MLRITFSTKETKRKAHTRKPEQAELADEVVAMFRSIPVSWPLDWQPLTGATPPTAGGLYALGFPRGIQYDRGISRIVYIGSAENLSRRIALHVRNAQNHAIWELQSLAPLGATWWTLPEMGRRWLYTLEGEAICVFERTFGAIPFGNWAVPESPHAGHCRDWIVIPPCDVSEPLCVDGLINKFRRRFCPVPGIKSITANQWYYGDFVRPSKEEIEEKHRKHEHERTMEQLSTIWCVHTATWSVKKLAALIQVCRTLQELPQRSTVI